MKRISPPSIIFASGRPACRSAPTRCLGAPLQRLNNAAILVLIGSVVLYNGIHDL
jgi:hypothetical protein